LHGALSSALPAQACSLEIAVRFPRVSKISLNFGALGWVPDAPDFG